MFRRTIRLCDYVVKYHKIEIRNYVRRGKNPGINYHLKVYKDDIDVQQEQEYLQNPDTLDDNESDFMDAHESHRQYQKEVHAHHEKIKQQIVNRKYFNEKQPNFLTYAEKEQIKTLYTRDPVEWDAEKLSESFPVSVAVVQKILKAIWLPKSKTRIRKHDEAVINNWKLFKAGEFPNLSPDLQEHLKKFSERTADNLDNLKIDLPQRPEVPKPKHDEFIRILTSCNKFQQSIKNNEGKCDEQIKNPFQPLKQLKDSTKLYSDDDEKLKNPFKSTNFTNIHNRIEENNEELKNPFSSTKLLKNPARNDNSSEDNIEKMKRPFSSVPNPASHDNEETYLIEKVLNKNPMRFQDLVSKKMIKLPTSNMEEDVKENRSLELNPNFGKTDNISNNDLEENFKEITISESNMKKFDVETIKEKIYIPRKLWKHGATYKVRDCYYDTDGEFLYRVPGMTRS